MTDLSTSAPPTAETGTCIYCGQMQTITDIVGEYEDGEFTDDELATMKCYCDESKRYQTFSTKLKAIEKSFEDENLVHILKTIARGILDDTIQGAAVEVDQMTKVKINTTTKDPLTIKKKYSESEIIS